MTDLADLIARVEAATGPARVLDRILFETLGTPSRERLGRGHAPEFTASVDAALALIERALPLGYPSLYRNYLPERYDGEAKEWSCDLSIVGGSAPYNVFEAEAHTPALALIAALLKALEPQP